MRPGRDLLRRAARTATGRRALRSLAATEPWMLLEALGPALRRDADLASVREWPERLHGFEDLAFLFSSNRANRGVISLDLDEAAYLFRLAASLGRATIVEIGRFRGGSTLLIAAAMEGASRLVSYDVHAKAGSGPANDERLGAALERYGLRERVELVVGDSRTAPGPDAAGLVFVDGDHSYEGARADVGRWRGVLPSGGHLLLHDAPGTRPLAEPHEGVARLAAELERDPELERAGVAGTLLHLRKR